MNLREYADQKKQERQAMRAAIGNGNNQYTNKNAGQRSKETDARGAHRVDSSTDLSGTENRAFLYNPKTDEMVVGRNFSTDEIEQTYDDDLNHAAAAHEAGLSNKQYDQYSVHGYIEENNQVGKGHEEGHTVKIVSYPDPTDVAATSDQRHGVLNKLTSHGIDKKKSFFSDGYPKKPMHQAMKTLAGPIGFAFDRTNPSAVNKVREQAGDLIKGISETTREQIKELVEEAFTDPEVDVHGLADSIDEIIDDPARAETIARTEVMDAANAGQVEAWEQATEDGLLTGNEEKEWIVTPDDRLCPVCEPMDGVSVPLDEDFDVDGDQIDGPPAHPNCRCTLGLKL